MYVLAPNCQVICRNLYPKDPQLQTSRNGWCLFLLKSSGFGLEHRKSRRDCKRMKMRREMRAQALWPDLSRPTAVEMEPIKDCEQLDQVLEQARQRNQPIVIDWMANWCRKCIFLKPKLEKLAAEFDTKFGFAVTCGILSAELFTSDIKGWTLENQVIPLQDLMKMTEITSEYMVKFYCVDVNSVPQALVKRGNISKMPTIQLWQDGEMKAEVIGGHQAWLVIEEVREMIRKYI